MNKKQHRILSVFLILMFSFFLLPANIAVAADIVSPIITLIGVSPITINEGDAYIEPGAGWTDVVDVMGSATVGSATVGGDVVDTQKPGIYVVTYNYTDGGINAAIQVTRVVIIKGIADLTPPVISPQTNINVQATSTSTAIITFTPTATDNIDPSITVISSPASGTQFPVGTTHVTLTAKDAAGNVATPVTFNVTVAANANVIDITPPVISSQPAINAQANSANTAIVTFSSIATDNVDPSITVTSSPASGTQFPLGTTQVTLTAKDAAGNVAAPVIFNITITGATTTTSPSTTFIGDNVIIILQFP